MLTHDVFFTLICWPARRYRVVERGSLDLSDYVKDARIASQSTRPKELVVKIDLPGQKSLRTADLKVFSKRIAFTLPPHPVLEITLPYPVRLCCHVTNNDCVVMSESHSVTRAAGME